jgi:2-keto-3-deoxy-L-fuconate dehydrogenase
VRPLKSATLCGTDQNRFRLGEPNNMAARLKGKTALVTAAGMGMGRAAAIAMAREGAKVFATDINKDALAELKSQARGIKTYLLDVTKPKQVERIVGKVGPVDVLFNCSGYVHHGTILECDDDAWDFSFNLNVKAQYHMAKAVLPGMIETAAARSSTWRRWCRP